MNTITAPGAGQRPAHHVYLFADFVLDTDRGSLARKNGEEVPLRPKSFEVLAYLVENPGRLISRDELLTAVWQDVIVTYDSLTQCLIDIRKALEDTGREMVRTLPRRGYLFDVTVERPGPEVSSQYLPAKSRGHRLLLFAAGASMALTAASIVVFQSNSSDNAPAVETAPAATAVDLDGSQPDYWLGVAGTAGALAFHGKLDWQEGLRQRKLALDTALTLDPLNAEAHIRLAQIQFQSGNMELTEAFLAQALELGQDNALVLSIAAGISYYEHRFDEAVALQRQAVELDPLHFVNRGNLAAYLFAKGQLEESAAEYMNARELNTDHAGPFDEQLARIRILQQRYEEAEKLVMKMPPGLWRDHGLALVHSALGREEANAVQERMLGHNESFHAAQMADVHAFRGDIDDSFHWLGVATEAVFDRGRAQLDQFTLLRLQTSPFLTALHDDPRWASWLAEVQRRIEQSQS